MSFYFECADKRTGEVKTVIIDENSSRKALKKIKNKVGNQYNIVYGRNNDTDEQIKVDAE